MHVKVRVREAGGGEGGGCSMEWSSLRTHIEGGRMHPCGGVLRLVVARSQKIKIKIILGGSTLRACNEWGRRAGVPGHPPETSGARSAIR